MTWTGDLFRLFDRLFWNSKDVDVNIPPPPYSSSANHFSALETHPNNKCARRLAICRRLILIKKIVRKGIMSSEFKTTARHNSRKRHRRTYKLESMEQGFVLNCMNER
jgi:hypothetical protein